jgi:hypothetical protein
MCERECVCETHRESADDASVGGCTWKEPTTAVPAMGTGRTGASRAFVATVMPSLLLPAVTPCSGSQIQVESSQMCLGAVSCRFRAVGSKLLTMQRTALAGVTGSGSKKRQLIVYHF